jgi:hypothetical protein
MDLQFKPVPVGDMAGSLALHINNFDPTETDAILEHRAHLLVIYDKGGLTVNGLLKLREQLRSEPSTTAPPVCALVTRIPVVSSLWYAVDRVVLVTNLNRYVGVPAQEIHFEWTPNDTTYPVVAPLGAQQSHIYATTSKGNFAALVEWAKQAPYPIGVIPRAL